MIKIRNLYTLIKEVASKQKLNYDHLLSTSIWLTPIEQSNCDKHREKKKKLFKQILIWEETYDEYYKNILRSLTCIIDSQ